MEPILICSTRVATKRAYGLIVCVRRAFGRERIGAVMARTVVNILQEKDRSQGTVVKKTSVFYGRCSVACASFGVPHKISKELHKEDKLEGKLVPN